MIEVVVSAPSYTVTCHVRASYDLSRSPQPFFHILANSIAEDIGEDNPRAILATTILAFAFSSVLTGQLHGLVDNFEWRLIWSDSVQG